MMGGGQQLERQIIAEATRLGFAAVGFATAGPSRTVALLEKWLAAGCAADMDFFHRNLQLRADPRELAPGARSLIVVAARYPVNDQPGRGFAMHARGEDYHAVLREKLEQLARFIRQAKPLSVARICVDSAPVLEREWAVTAGIGWRGKQGQIVNAGLGCCLVLGELLVDSELAPSPPAANQCGDCRLCLDACPTGALAEDGQVDARRCVSYLTIEHKGDIAPDLRPRIGGALFGCDRCTAICPWNRFGKDRIMPELRPDRMPSAEECLSMTEAEFRKRFKPTTVWRTGLARLQRNARLAMANRGQ